MTTVVAVAREGQTWVGADTMTNVYDRPVPTAQKIRTVEVDGKQDAVAIAFAGDGGGPAALRDLTITALPTQDAGDHQAWADATAQAITELYVERGLTDGGRMDGNVLLALPGHLWTIVHQQAIYHEDGLAALGSGEGPAIGALTALLQHDVAPLEAVSEAVAIAIRMDRFSGGRTQIQHMRA